MLLLVTLLLGGCGLKIAYNNADRFALLLVGRVLGLNDEQKDLLRQPVREFHLWHRTEHLPQYAALLDEVAGALPGVQGTELLSWEAQVEQWFEEMGMRTFPAAAATLRGLDADQISKLENNLTEEAEKQFKDWIEDPRDAWEEMALDQFGDRIGRPNREQRAMIAAAAQRYQPDSQAWMAYQSRWNAELVALLRERLPYAAYLERLKILWFEPEAFYPPGLMEMETANDEQARKLVLDLLASLTDKQLASLKDRLGSLSADLQSLAGRIPDRQVAS